MTACERHVFVIGGHGAGKTTLAWALGVRMAATVTSAGGWVRARWPDLDDADLASASDRARAADPNVAVAWVRTDCSATTPLHVVEGIRHPHDLHALGRPATDRVVIVDGGASYDWEVPGLRRVLELVARARFPLAAVPFRGGLGRVDDLVEWCRGDS